MERVKKKGKNGLYEQHMVVSLFSRGLASDAQVLQNRSFFHLQQPMLRDH
jgi:hypothetical protein